MTIAIYPGTFDPFTLGHVDLVLRAAGLFERVIVAIAASPSKQPLFSLTERLALGQNLFSSIPNVEALPFSGLLVDFARQQQANVVIRGIRSVGDFEFEEQLARMNAHLQPGLETLFMLPAVQYAHISSTLVREIAGLGGDVSSLVPAAVSQVLVHKKR
jgi:pantetheine-phosphate adenylyltransferase